MTQPTNARLAGAAFLLYIVAGIASMALPKGAAAADLLNLFCNLCALTLGVTLFALTREVDFDLALIAMGCRLIEATANSEGKGAIFFAIGSTIFAWLLMRGRLIPAALGWLGVAASALLVVILPLQRAHLFGRAGSWASKMTWLIWMPALVFELGLAFCLLVKAKRLPPAVASKA